MFDGGDDILDSRDNIPSSAGRERAFPAYYGALVDWRRAVSEQLIAESVGEPPLVRGRIVDRGGRIAHCGTHLELHQCGGCGETESARISALRTCRCRICPYCGSVSRRTRLAKAWKAKAEARQIEGCNWYLVSLSLQYDPAAPESYTIPALRAAVGMIRSMSDAVRDSLNGSSGGFLSIEMSPKGNVHGHLVLHTKGLTSEGICAAVASANPGRHVGGVARFGIPHLVDFGKSEGAEPAVEGALRGIDYVAKGHYDMTGDKMELLMAGEHGVELLHPTLAARWEIATYNRHLGAAFGVFHGAGEEVSHQATEALVPDQQEPATPDDQKGDRRPHRCVCGAVGCVQVATVEATAFLRSRHRQGLWGLHRTNRRGVGPPIPAPTNVLFDALPPA